MSDRALIRRLLVLARPVRGWLALSVLCRIGALAAAAALLIIPAFALSWAAADRPRWGLTAALMVISALAAGGLRYAEQLSGHRAAFALLADMRTALYEAIAPQSRLRRRLGSGEVLSTATGDVDRVEVFFAHTIGPALTGMLMPAAACGLTAHWAGAPAAFAAAAAFALAWAVPVLAAGRARADAEAVAEARSGIAQHLAEDAAGRAEIRTFAAEAHRAEGLRTREESLADALGRSGRSAGLRAAFGLAWPWCAAVAVLVLGRGESVIAAAMLVFGTAPALTSVEAFARGLPSALASARRYLAVVDGAPDVEDPASPMPLPSGPLSLSVEAVDVSFDGDRDVLADFSAEIAAGERVGVVGPSGAGKSTLLRLALRMADPAAGVVRVGGVDVRHAALGDLRRAVGLVEQHPLLIEGTVLDNLRFGFPSLGEDAAADALDAVGLTGELSERGGLSLRLGPGGRGLSGGQSQRLALARVLARRPRLLLLDEATSHQDPETQAAIGAALDSLTGVTIVVVAHRREAHAIVDRLIDVG